MKPRIGCGPVPPIFPESTSLCCGQHCHGAVRIHSAFCGELQPRTGPTTQARRSRGSRPPAFDLCRYAHSLHAMLPMAGSATLPDMRARGDCAVEPVGTPRGAGSGQQALLVLRLHFVKTCVAGPWTAARTSRPAHLCTLQRAQWVRQRKGMACRKCLIAKRLDRIKYEKARSCAWRCSAPCNCASRCASWPHTACGVGAGPAAQ